MGHHRLWKPTIWDSSIVKKNTLLGGTYVLPPTAREPPRAWGKIYRKITYLFWHNNKRRVWFDYAFLLNRGRLKPWCTQIFRWKLSFFSIRLLVVKKRNIKSSLVSLLRLQEFFTKDTYIIFFDAASISDICFAKKKKKESRWGTLNITWLSRESHVVNYQVSSITRFPQIYCLLKESRLLIEIALKILT